MSGDEKLVELFRKAMPAHQLHWKSIVTGKKVSKAKLFEALAAVQAFDLAANTMPSDFSPLMTCMGGPGTLRDALMAMVTEKERKKWQAFARRYEQCDLTVNPSPAAKRALEYLEECRRDV
jgi:hypothetical protein